MPLQNYADAMLDIMMMEIPNCVIRVLHLV
jgi:hypothetical protein